MGSVEFRFPASPPSDEPTCRVEADLALIPVRQNYSADKPLLKTCVPSVSLDRTGDCRIAVAERECVVDDGVVRPFRVRALKSHGTAEIAVVMQLVSANGRAEKAQQLVWKQSDVDSPMASFPHQEVDVSGAGRIEILVSRGPIAVLRTTSIEKGFAISHGGKPYLRVDTPLGSALYAPPHWPEDETDSCLGGPAPEGLRIWREFGGDGPWWQSEYQRKVQFGLGLIDQPTLVIVGDGCIVQSDGKVLYALDKPFVLILTKYTHDPCFCTEGAPYLTLVGALRPPGAQPWLLGIENWRTGRPVESRVTLTHSRGRVRMERLAEDATFQDYDKVSARGQSAYLVVRPTDAESYYIRALCDDVSVGDRCLVRSYWATSAEWVHWICYGILTFLWLPILQWIAHVVWGT